MPDHDEERLLTDADVKAITDALENRLYERFYGNLGKGVWAIAWKAVVVFAVGLAAYGSAKGMK